MKALKQMKAELLAAPAVNGLLERLTRSPKSPERASSRCFSGNEAETEKAKRRLAGAVVCSKLLI